MENTKTEIRPPKSTILLVLFLFLLFNAAHLFRTSINTLYFAEDTSSDYAPVQATVVKLQPEMTDEAAEEPRIIPIFSFLYKGEKKTMEAPKLAFQQSVKTEQPFTQGQKYTLWVHKRWGELILPPAMGQKELGRSQMVISAVFLLLAISIWILRNKMGAKATH